MPIYSFPTRINTQIIDAAHVNDLQTAVTELGDIADDRLNAVYVASYGAVGNGVTDDTTAIQTAINAASGRGAGELGGVVYFPSGTYLISSPLILPRTGDGTGAVHLVGESSRWAMIKGSSAFPTGRALIEWEAVAARAWNQRIAHLRFFQPDVAQVRAVHYDMVNVSTLDANINNERLQIVMEDVSVRSNNDYHDATFVFEGSVWYSRFNRVIGEPNYGADATKSVYDTTLFQFDSALNSGVTNPVSAGDFVGLSYSPITNCHSMLRRGGNSRLVQGRLYNVTIEECWADGGRFGPALDIINSVNVRLTRVATEGKSQAASFRFTNCQYVTLDDFGVGFPRSLYPAWAASTAYALDARVTSPSVTNTGTLATTTGYFKVTVAGTSGTAEPAWPAAVGGTVVDGTVTWERVGEAVGNGVEVIDSKDVEIGQRWVGSQSAIWSYSGVRALKVDATSERVRAEPFNLRALITTGTPDNEIQIDAPAQNLVYVAGRDIGNNVSFVRGLWPGLTGRVTALPTATAALRGVIARVDGGAGVADMVYVGRKNASDAYEWAALL